MGKSQDEEDLVAFQIVLPRWMLEDMRDRARRINLSTSEWIRYAVSEKAYKEDHNET